MNVYEAIENRRSIRKYKPDDVPQPVLDRILSAVRLAPSGCNRQAWKLIVVRDRDTISKVTEACRARFPGPDGKLAVMRIVANAPVVIVACGIVKGANIRYFRVDDEDPVIFSDRSRDEAAPRYWDEYLEHDRTHSGEYESTGIWDLAIVLDHLTLAAVEEGLGTCWIGTTDEKELRSILSIPDDVQARMIMILGYPDESPDSRPKKPVEELVCYERHS